MTNTISPFTQIPSEPLAAPATQYPYLVVRIFSAAYQRERIDIRQGKLAVQIGAGKCYVQHPEPRLINNDISEGCRALLLAGVSAAVNKTNFRMCIKWGEASCSFVECDGVINESSESPSGGIDMPSKLAFDQRIALQESESKEDK
jgi:hypothetical protein